MDYRFGPFRLNAQKRRLWRADELVPLTPKAIKTLLVLVARAGEVVEKDEIMKAVWPDTFVEEATLAQNISTLRKALGDTSEMPEYIATVPRRGYRFLATVTEVLDAQREPNVGSPSGIANTDRIDGGEVTTAPDSSVTGPREMAPAAERKTRERFWMAVSAALTLGLIAIGVRAMRTASPPIIPVVFAISPSEGTSFSTSGGFMAVSPDGRDITFVASGPDGTDRLWLRPLDSLTQHPLSGTEGASQPFWSKDSRFVAFFANGKLKKVDVVGGPAQTICDTPIGSIPLAGTWNGRDDILFSAVRQGILRVPATGGIASPLVSKGSEDDYVGWPQFLSDGRHFLYLLGSRQPDLAGIYVGALDSTERSRLVATRSYALYAPSGHLLFLQDGTLVAQPFDDVNRKLTGEPLAIADRVAFNAATRRGAFSLSQTGMLAYRTVGETELAWFDRNGKSLGPAGPVGGYLRFSVSPDNRRVAAARLDPHIGTSDIWIIDAAGASQRRLTFDTSWETSPLWSRDGSRIAFNSERSGRWEIYEKASSGDGLARRLVSSDTSVSLEDWTPDGRVLFQQSSQKIKSDFWLLGPPDKKPVRVPYLESDEGSGRISPDGRWLAYIGHESGWSIYVRSLQSMNSRWPISPEGGAEPRWRADGKELFYLSPDLSMMAMDIEPGPTLRAGAARRLFQTQAVAPSGLTGQAYDVTSDGQRFLVKVPASFSPITVVVNWTSVFQNRR